MTRAADYALDRGSARLTCSTRPEPVTARDQRQRYVRGASGIHKGKRCRCTQLFKSILILALAIVQSETRPRKQAPSQSTTKHHCFEQETSEGLERKSKHVSIAARHPKVERSRHSVAARESEPHNALIQVEQKTKKSPPPASAMWQRPPPHWLCLLQEQCEVFRRPSPYRVKPYSSASSAPRSMAFFFQNRTCSSN